MIRRASSSSFCCVSSLLSLPSLSSSSSSSPLLVMPAASAQIWTSSRFRRSLLSSASVSSNRAPASGNAAAASSRSSADGGRIRVDSSRFAHSQSSVEDPLLIDFQSSVVREDILLASTLNSLSSSSSSPSSSSPGVGANGAPSFSTPAATNSLRASPVATVRIFDPRRNNKYFDDILFNDDEHEKKQQQQQQQQPQIKKSNSAESKKLPDAKSGADGNASLSSPSSTPSPTSDVVSSSPSSKRRLRLQSVDTGLGDNALNAALSFLDNNNNNNNNNAAASSSSSSLSSHASTASSQTSASSKTDAAAAAALAALKNLLSSSPASAPSSSSIPAVPILPAGVKGKMVRIVDLKRAILHQQQPQQRTAPSTAIDAETKKLLGSTSLLGLLRRHANRDFDVSGDGVFVSFHGGMSLSQKMPPAFTPTARFGIEKKQQNGDDSNDEEVDLLKSKKSKKNKKNGLLGDDDALSMDAEPAEWVGVELDLDMDEQAEMNRIVQEAAELERLEELEETGKLDTLIKSGKFGLLGIGTDSDSSSKRQKTTAEILKSFANEFHALPDAPEASQSAAAVAISSILQAASKNAGKTKFSETITIMGPDGKMITGIACAPPLPAKLKLTPKPLKAQAAASASMLRSSTAGGATTTPQLNMFVPSTQSATAAGSLPSFSSSSSSSGSGLLAVSQTELLELFVQMVPTFFVPVMLLKLNDKLREVTGGRDIDKVIRRNHFYFDFKIGAGGSLHDMQVKLKTTVEHPNKGAADELYSDFSPSEEDAVTTNTGASPIGASTNSAAAAAGGGGGGGADKPKTVPSSSSSSSSAGANSSVTALAPRIAPIRLATDSVDEQCQAFMSALNAIEEATASQQTHGGDRAVRKFTATPLQIYQTLSSNSDAATSSSAAGAAALALPLRSEQEALDWARARPRMFITWWDSSSLSSTTTSPSWRIGLRPLNVAPGAVSDFAFDKLTEQQEQEINVILAVCSTSAPQPPSLEVLKQLYSKVRAGVWTELSTLKKKFPAATAAASADPVASWLHDSSSKSHLPLWYPVKAPSAATGTALAPGKEEGSDDEVALSWMKLFGRSVWIDEHVAGGSKKGKSKQLQRARKFTGSADLDDVEHFGLRVLYSQVKQMVSPEKIDVDLVKEVVPQLPACCAALFYSPPSSPSSPSSASSAAPNESDEQQQQQHLELVVKILKSHPSLFAVKMDPAKKTVMVGLASLFRK